MCGKSRTTSTGRSGEILLQLTLAASYASMASTLIWVCTWATTRRGTHLRHVTTMEHEDTTTWSLLAFFDIANAFPSMSRGRLDSVVDQCANSNDKWALQARRHEATTIITSTIQPAEAACVQPTTGDMQGDCAAAQ
eukprot:13672852-Heterocapsa_arctica.AAC.1